MAKRVFTSDLSVEGVESLIKALEEYRDTILPNLLKKFVEKLSNKGVEIAQADVVSLDAIFTGELFNSITSRSENVGNDIVTFYVVADSEHAAFVEFGTGQIGSETPYPGTFENVDWKYSGYMTGEHIFEFRPGQYGWFYRRDGKWYFTQGMPSRPFMYQTAIDLRKFVPEIAREVFK